MKKMMLAIAAIAMMTVSAQAVSFLWTSAAPIKFGETTLGTTGAFTAYLVDLGVAGTWGNYMSGVTTEAELNDGSVASSGVRTTGGASNVGKILAVSYGVDGNQLVNYGVLVVHNDGADNWYNLSSIYTVANIADNVQGDQFNAAFSSFTGMTDVTDANAIGTSGWYRVVPIPEPATAALALAGLAMLIRRRK